MNKLLSAALFSLAVAICYFGYQLAQISSQFVLVEQALATVDRQLPQILQESQEIRKQVASTTQVVEGISQQIPAILNQLDQTTQTLADYEGHVPSVVEQVASINTNVAQFTPHIPELLASTRQMSKTIDDTNETMRQITPLVPEVLEEVATTREELPGLLDRVDTLVANAKDIGSKTTQGAVSGIFTGILRAPVDLLGSLASPFTQQFDKSTTEVLKEEDYFQLNQAIERAWQLETDNQPVSWQTKNDNRGNVTIVKRTSENCFVARISIQVKNKKKRKADTREIAMCRTKKGTFEPK